MSLHISLASLLGQNDHQTMKFLDKVKITLSKVKAKIRNLPLLFHLDFRYGSKLKTIKSEQKIVILRCLIIEQLLHN